MTRLFHRAMIVSLAVVLVFAISSRVSAQQTRPIEFNANLGFGEYGFDSGYIGLDKAYAKMQVRAYGILDLNLADVTMNGKAETSSGTIWLTGTDNGGEFSFNLGLEYGVYAYYGIPALNLDYDLDLLTLFDISSKDLRINDSQIFDPFLLDDSVQISDSIYFEKVLPDLDLTEILLPGIPFAGAGVTLDADMELQETLSGERIYFSNPGSSIDSENDKLPFSGSSTILSYYENANAEVIVGFWPGLYAEVGALRFEFTPIRFPKTVYSRNLPLAFNNAQVNFSSSGINITNLSLPSTVEPYGSFEVSGYAEYDTGDPVGEGTAVIVVEGGGTYSAAVYGGYFSRRDVHAPGNNSTSNITRTVEVIVNDGTVAEGSETRQLTVLGQGVITYDLTTEIVYDYEGDNSSLTWWSKPAFRTTDSWVEVIALFENMSGSGGLDLMWRCFRPYGSQYGNDLVWNDAIDLSWGWGWASWGWLIDGDTEMSRVPGKYRIDFFVNSDRKATHDFVVGWDFAQHKMSKDYNQDWLPVTPTNIFSTDDTRAVACHEFRYRAQELNVKGEFYAPNGSKYSEHSWTFEDDLGPHEWYDWSRYVMWIWIDGHDAEHMCGDWTVKFYVQRPKSGVWYQEYTDYFRIEEHTPPSKVTVSASSDSPIETQTITLNASAEDNNHLQKVVLHWNDGADHTQTWDNIDAGTYNGSRDIGSYGGGTDIEYWAEAWDKSGNRSESQHHTITVIPETITTPDCPSGEKYPQIGESVTFSTGGSTTTLDHLVQYQFDWGDGTLSDWGSDTQPNFWLSDGVYFVRARARCQTHTNRISVWSAPIVVCVDSTGPIVKITTNSGTDFETDQPQIVLEGTSTEPVPASGLASVSINTGEANEGTLYDWKFTVDLSVGPNVLTVTSTDNVGNVGTDTIMVTYQVHGTITVNPDPDSLNAPWTLTGPNGYNHSGTGDETVTGLEPGKYILNWGDVGGWITPTPDPETKNLPSGSSITFAGTYLPDSELKGDVNGDGNVDLVDAILALQVMAGIEPSATVYKEADVNGDGKIGIEEVIYVFQKVSGLRE